MRRFAEANRPGGALVAILSWAWPRPVDWTHVYFRSREEPGLRPRAGFTVDRPLRARALHLQGLSGLLPRALDVEVRTAPEDPFQAIDAPFEAQGLHLTAALPDVPLYGLAVALRPGGGPAGRPDLLTFAALGLTLAEGGLTARVERATPGPDLPFPAQPPEGCLLPLHGCTRLRLQPAGHGPLHGLRLDFARLGRFGDAAQVRAFLAGAELLVETAGGQRPTVGGRFRLAAEGLHAGLTRATLLLDPPVPDAAALLLAPAEVPPELSLLGAAWLADATDPSAAEPLPEPALRAVPIYPTDAPGDPPGEALRADPFPSLVAARRLHVAPPMAASVGLPGQRLRLGASPAGTVFLSARRLHPEADTPSGALHVALDRPDVPLLDPRPGVLHLRLGGAGVEPAELSATADATCAHLRLRSAGASPLRLSLALRDALQPLPFTPRLAWADGLATLWLGDRPLARVAGLTEPPTLEVGAHETVLTLSGAELRIVFALDGDLPPHHSDAFERAVAAWQAARSAVLGPPADVHLPWTWATLHRSLLDQAAQLFDAGDTVPYGRFPGCYDADVFGLEEDWLFHALAAWGHGAAAWRGFRATYLTSSHMDKAHYLHDLRNGLTPWQALRLLALAPCPDFPDTREAALLVEGGEWAIASRRHDTPGALPGLFPPFRYGGDLDFPTQSLTGNAANVSGLHALSRLPGLPEGLRARFAAEAIDFRAAWEAALDAVRTCDAAGRPFLPMHTGGGDPGQYHALMVCGILEPLGLLGPAAPHLADLHTQMEASGALRLGLPRFDVWGTGGRGIDAHYATGYLQDLLHRGRPEAFQIGLLGLFAAAMDPVTTGFREVSDLLSPGEAPWMPDLLPGRLLAQAEPCVGGLGVGLELLRQALFCEVPDAWGLPTGLVRVLPAVPPDFWEGGDFHLRDLPTAGGPVTLHVRNRLRAGHPHVEVEVEAPAVQALQLHAPSPPGYTRTEGPATLDLPPGRHRVRWGYTPVVQRPRVRTAVIPAAGLGTRLLPATVSIPKELLPIGAQPALLASLLEVENAGIEHVVLVTAPGKEALRRALEPESWPAAAREHNATAALRDLLGRLRLSFVTQPEPVGALEAIARGRAAAPDGPYVVLYPDFVHLPDQTALAHVLAAWEAVRCTTYGLYAPDPAQAGLHGSTALVTPAPGERAGPGLPTLLDSARAPYGPPRAGELRTLFAVVQDETWDERLQATGTGDEALLPTLDALAREGRLAGTLLPGEVLDLGVPGGYREAVRRFATGEARWRGPHV